MSHQGTTITQTITADPSSSAGWFLLLGMILFFAIMAYVMWKGSNEKA